MFYSQFILAKKGPLGTIWIAAHLERKLRKNQVADTDIGDSVDSIISPDIPIALRLSSHLLLGVVRIYSRKVNYLFHDCSETLLKVKQAFRSTVVDLPPEESTAPYHSITLPETFDLEDFVLPDTAILNGNFVDHHVSTREQITLQDSVEGTELSTLQFGLDERFGDGDAPQIGLDLDEELFLDKGLSDQNVTATLGSEEIHERMEIAGLSEIPFTPMDTDDCHDGKTPKDMSMDDSLGKPYTTLDSNIGAGFSNIHGYNVQTPDLNEMVFGDIGAPSEVLDNIDVSYSANINSPYIGPHENAEAPSTPGLVEKAIPGNNIQEAAVLSPQGIENDIIPDEIPTHEGPKHNKLETDSLNLSSQDLDVEMNCDIDVPKGTLNSNPSLQPCSSHLHPFDAASLEGTKLEENNFQTSEIEMPSDGKNIGELSLEKLGEGIELVTDPDTVHISSDMLPLENSADRNKPDDLAEVVTNDSQFRSTFSASSEYPEPERMLLAPSGGQDLQDDSEQGTSGKGTSEPARTIDANRNLSNEKGYLVEETPDLEHGSSVKVSGIARMKRKFNHIPEDDDLLASILVGKGASSLKLKSTPSLPTALFSKRSRLAAKTGATKRKVLQDDTMVLHADGIRQQLMSTEDIRRTRKKAPCTRSEIWMIEKSFSDEIFGESILSGMPDELASLYYQNYDPNEVPSSGAEPCFNHSDVPKLDQPNSSDKKEELPCSSGIVEKAEGSEIIEKAKGAENSLISVLEKNDNLALQSESNLQIVTQDCGTALNNIEHDAISSIEQDFSSLIINNVHTNQDCIDGGVENVNNDANSSLDNSVFDKPTESTAIVGDAITCVLEFPENSNSVNPDAVINEPVMVEPSETQLEVSFDDQNASSTFPLELGFDMKTNTSSLGLSDPQDAPTFPTTGDSCGFCSATGGNVTDFLIADDDADLIEEADYDIPNTEAQSLENSGWSVRTRSVAKYLKLLFENESGTGRKMIEMDRLLIGKTRKEASRMFFETLVLKTKDYVQVQQENSFNDINIKPTMKLQKSEF